MHFRAKTTSDFDAEFNQSNEPSSKPIKNNDPTVVCNINIDASTKSSFINKKNKN